MTPPPNSLMRPMHRLTRHVSARLSLLLGGVLLALSADAADLNQANRAEIEAVRGVGVELADRILAARQDGPFRDWADLRRRVRGVGVRPLAGFFEAEWRIDGQRPPQAATPSRADEPSAAHPGKPSR